MHHDRKPESRTADSQLRHGPVPERPLSAPRRAVGALGNQGLLRLSSTLGLQARLEVSQPGDPYELEADRVADEIMRQPLSAPPPPTASSPAIQRRCAPCTEEGQTLQMKGDFGAAAEVDSELETEIRGLSGRGQPLPPALRADLEPRFGADLGAVRLHTDAQAQRLAGAVSAQAFTVGRDVIFGAGRYAPETEGGRHLLAHELTHVVQQGGGGSARAVEPLIQRTSHSGTTPTNCHNWKIPLPPWIAGTIAHGQISSLLAIPPAGIPRATKLLMGFPSPPAITPMGFADLHQRNPASVGIAEIKSTQTGDGPARAEAAHYVLRHLEWLTRAPWAGDATDLNYAARVGGPFPGSILDLSARTGPDLNLGMFWGDPLKQLHIEADSLGSVVYWCTGAGLPFSPLWYPVFRRLINDIKDLLNQAKRALQGVAEGIAAAAATAWATIRGWIGDIVDWGMANSRVLAFLLLLLICIVAIVVLVISILAEAPSGGTSTVPAIASVAALAGAATGMLILLGISTPDLPAASTTVAMALMPDEADAQASGPDYERNTGTGDFPSSAAAAATVRADPAGDFIAALAPLRDPVAILRAVSGTIGAVPPGGVRQLGNGIDLLERNGDAATASFLRAQLAANGLA